MSGSGIQVIILTGAAEEVNKSLELILRTPPEAQVQPQPPGRPIKRPAPETPPRTSTSGKNLFGREQVHKEEEEEEEEDSFQGIEFLDEEAIHIHPFFPAPSTSLPSPTTRPSPSCSGLDLIKENELIMQNDEWRHFRPRHYIPKKVNRKFKCHYSACDFVAVSERGRSIHASKKHPETPTDSDPFGTGRMGFSNHEHALEDVVVAIDLASAIRSGSVASLAPK